MPAIKIENLSKQFNGFTAVDNISLEVASGELFGLLGPNGAGKTTTINILCTLLHPSSGRAEIAGRDVFQKQNEVRQKIGLVFQEPALEAKLTGRENLKFHGLMYGLPLRQTNHRIKEVLELVELSDRADVLVKKYSGGMKRRLEIARGLLHCPEVLFLDEPTLGLDPQTRRRIWDYLKKLNRQIGVTMILTTHYLEEADYLCDRIAIIDHGQIIASGKPPQLKDILGGDIICLEVTPKNSPLAEQLRKIQWIKEVKEKDGFLYLTMEKAETRIQELINLINQNQIQVGSLSLKKPSLEEVFLHFTGRSLRDEEKI
jgi:ABC-2 type transport system ATP-binding protein